MKLAVVSSAANPAMPHSDTRPKARSTGSRLRCHTCQASSDAAEKNGRVGEQTQNAELQPKPQRGEVDVLATFRMFHRQRPECRRPGDRETQTRDRMLADRAEHVGALVQAVAILYVRFDL